MSDTAILTPDFELVIPAALRDERHWRPGQRYAFIPKGAGLLIVPVPEVSDMKGIAAGADPSGARDRSDRVWCASSTPPLGSSG